MGHSMSSINAHEIRGLERLTMTRSLEMKNIVPSVLSSSPSNFYLACRNGEIDVVKKMLERTDQQYDINRIESNGSTALHAACYYGHADIVMMLLRKGAVRTKRNKYGFVPLDEAANDGVRELFRMIPDNNQLEVNQIDLNCIQFVLANLTQHLTPLTSKILYRLQSLTADTIRISENTIDIDFYTKYKKTMIIFTTSEFLSTVKELPEGLLKLYVLESDKNKVDQIMRFNSIKDLIFQLADDLYYYYKWESRSDAILGYTYSARLKEKHANDIYNVLKEVYSSVSTNRTSICATTELICLKSSDIDDTTTENKIKLFDNIVTSSLTFDDPQSCLQYVRSIEKDSTIFVIIGHDYDETLLNQFKDLPQVKNVYQYNKSSVKNSANTDECDDYYFDLIHDLIAHYNRLATKYKVAEDDQNTKEMFLKAHKLSQLLIKL